MKLLILGFLATIAISQVACNGKLNSATANKANDIAKQVVAADQVQTSNSSGQLYSSQPSWESLNTGSGNGYGIFQLRSMELSAATGFHDLISTDLDVQNPFYKGISEAGASLYFSSSSASSFRLHYMGVDNYYYTIGSDNALNKPVADIDEDNGTVLVQWNYPNFSIIMSGYFTDKGNYDMDRFISEFYFYSNGNYSQIGSSAHTNCEVTDDPTMTNCF